MWENKIAMSEMLANIRVSTKTFAKLNSCSCGASYTKRTCYKLGLQRIEAGAVDRTVFWSQPPHGGKLS